MWPCKGASACFWNLARTTRKATSVVNTHTFLGATLCRFGYTENYNPEHTALYTRRRGSCATPLWEPKILFVFWQNLVRKFHHMSASFPKSRSHLRSIGSRRVTLIQVLYWGLTVLQWPLNLTVIWRLLLGACVPIYILVCKGKSQQYLCWQYFAPP
jgi:hypothetical protein